MPHSTVWSYFGHHLNFREEVRGIETLSKKIDFLQLITCAWWQNTASESPFCVQLISLAFPAVRPTPPQFSICRQPPPVPDFLMTTQAGFKTWPSNLYGIFDPQHFFYGNTEIKASGREKWWHIFQRNWFFLPEVRTLTGHFIPSTTFPLL